MGFIKKLFTNMFLRNMLSDFGVRSSNSMKNDAITPFFQYKIGSYQRDYFLYFPKEPFVVQYTNEIFNKLLEYNGFQIIKYLEFHYSLYIDKYDFIRFLQYEILERLKRKPGKNRLLKLQSAFDWVMEKTQDAQIAQRQAIQHDIEQKVRLAIESKHTNKEESINLTKSLTESITNVLTNIIEKAEKRIDTLVSSYPTGNIQLNNHAHLEKVIQTLILLQTVKAPDKIAKGEQLFKSFSTTDLAFLLNLHFLTFKSMKPNTVQVRIKEYNDRLRLESPKVQKLADALRDRIIDTDTYEFLKENLNRLKDKSHLRFILKYTND